MGLVNDLQQSAEADDVLTVLRRAKRVSAKLSLPDICEWLDHEQNGYPTDIDVPPYRNVSICICYNTNGYIPAGYGQLMKGIVPLPVMSARLKRRVHQPISAIAAWLTRINAGECIYESIGGDDAETLRASLKTDAPDLLEQLTFLMRYDNAALAMIPEAIKDKVLNWACELERAGITGDGQSFSDDEKQVAQRVEFRIEHCTIDQLNSSGTNLKETPR